jgi:ABC-type uncharacterized transport system auxiliary subunit
MPSALLIAMCVFVIAGCVAKNDDYQLNKKTAAQEGDKEWKTFIAPLSTKTQSPQERVIERWEREKQR